jgi:hypothetical protein
VGNHAGHRQSMPVLHEAAARSRGAILRLHRVGLSF